MKSVSNHVREDEVLEVYNYDGNNDDNYNNSNNNDNIDDNNNDKNYYNKIETSDTDILDNTCPNIIRISRGRFVVLNNPKGRFHMITANSNNSRDNDNNNNNNNNDDSNNDNNNNDNNNNDKKDINNYDYNININNINYNDNNNHNTHYDISKKVEIRNDISRKVEIRNDVSRKVEIRNDISRKVEIIISDREKTNEEYFDEKDYVENVNQIFEILKEEEKKMTNDEEGEEKVKKEEEQVVEINLEKEDYEKDNKQKKLRLNNKLSENNLFSEQNCEILSTISSFYQGTFSGNVIVDGNILHLSDKHNVHFGIRNNSYFIGYINITEKNYYTHGMYILDFFPSC